MSYLKKNSSYVKENTTRDHYKDKMVNAKKTTANYSENFTRPTNADLLNVTSRTKSSYYWVLKSQHHQFLRLFICCVVLFHSGTPATEVTKDLPFCGGYYER